MAIQNPTNPPTAIEERIRAMEQTFERLTRINTNIAPRPAAEPRTWLERWFPGISIIAIAGFAFWLGMINATVNNTAARVDKVYSIILESRDSLTTRTSVIESKLDSIDKKLDEAITQPNAKTKKP